MSGPNTTQRRKRLHDAAALVAADPPILTSGDILDTIPTLVDRAPVGTHVVVFHSAALAYLDPERRDAFAGLMASLENVTWISNEGADVLPAITDQVPVEMNGRFIVAVNGHAAALAGPHGQSYQAL